MISAASTTAIAYSMNSTDSNWNALARNGTSHTSVVSRKLPTAAQLSILFMRLSENRLPRWMRMLKLWKISARLMVKNAIVVPSALLAISHTPDSM